MISIEHALGNERRMRALTSMGTDAFQGLLALWKTASQAQAAQQTVEGHGRQRAVGGGRKGVMGRLFGWSQPQVCEWVARLLPMLEKFMTVHLPARHGRQLSEVLAAMPEVGEVLLDGTERPISRPEHKGRRDAHYSGRRKRTTVKNVVVTANHRVVLLTPTVPGRRHDKTEADKARIRLPAGMRLLADSGLQGYRAGAATVCTPHKKPRERPLHWQHRRANRKLAQVRVAVEHVFSSVKRLGVLRQPLRMRDLMLHSTYGDIWVNEQRLRQGRHGAQVRPFCERAQVRQNAYSLPLQRILTDFGAEESFVRATERVRAHYGIELAASGVRQQTLIHARAIGGVEHDAPKQPARTIITQMDGCMLPIVEPLSDPAVDRRQGKKLLWREARLCCARSQKQVDCLYGATFGSVKVPLCCGVRLRARPV